MKKLRHSIGRSSVKEAFDNLPSGICNFDKRGIPVLVNRKMDRLSFDLMGHDLQYEEEFAKAVSELKDGLFHEENGSIWEFQKNEIEGLGVEYIATDVTKIYEDNQILEEKNRELKEMARVLEETSRNIVAVAREEEILAMKMRIHGEMGKSVLRMQQYLHAERSQEEKDELILQLKRTVSLLKGEVGQTDQMNPMEELMDTAKAIGARIVLHGELPKDREVQKILMDAMRECLTNTIQHAGGDCLHVSVYKDMTTVHADLTNNGNKPTASITEGGGLSSLRQKIERAGGTMKITIDGGFCLSVSIPDKGGVME